MIDKEALIKSFDNRRIADYLIGDDDLRIENGINLKMPYMSFNDICQMDKSVFDGKITYNGRSSRWIEMLYRIRIAINENKINILLEYLFSIEHFKSVVASKDEYIQLIELGIMKINGLLSLYDIKIERFNGRIKLISTVNNEEISFDTETESLEVPIQSNELLNHRILSNLLLFSKSKEEALSWISIIDSIEGYPVELIKEIKIRYTSNDFLTFKVVTDKLQKLFERIIA